MNDKEKLEFAKELDNCIQCQNTTSASKSNIIYEMTFYHLRDHNINKDQCGVGIISQGGSN